MNAEEPLDRWIAQRRAQAVPAGFADRVLARVANPADSAYAAWWRKPAIRAAAWIGAFVVLAARLVLAGAVFLRS